LLFVIYAECHIRALYAEWNYADFRILLIAMLNVVMRNVVMLSVVTLSVVMLNVIMLNVVTPFITVHRLGILFQGLLSRRSPAFLWCRQVSMLLKFLQL
jgi:hypothetical protein